MMQFCVKQWCSRVICVAALLTACVFAPAFASAQSQNGVSQIGEPVRLPGMENAPWMATLRQADFVTHDFHFRDGETLPEVKIHYYALGKPERDASGKTTNAVLIMHGTGGTGRGFLSATYAGVLFGPGQLLDAQKYFIILPDDIGHGMSSKPSDGLNAHFPHYDYDDMVAAEHLMVTEGLGVNHLLIVMGTSMGCMHSWVWGETYPDFMDALVPLACQPVEIAGRNRMLRKMVIDAIKTDPAWLGGDYTTEPHGMLEAIDILLIMTSSPLQWQKNYPTGGQADRFLDQQRKTRIPTTDANDMLYAFDSSRDYNPDPNLEKIQARVLSINSEDDQVNPPELGIAEREIKRVKNGKFVLLPITDQTRGHGTHSLPAVWGNYLAELLHSLGR
ncbi:MAG TPA: alpha/beta fold hydrolase [Candidatus Acidoferrales bacterium]|nr:alpha/beta fold hydrolase [Candidatus Acidoferrales bacterium]